MQPLLTQRQAAAVLCLTNSSSTVRFTNRPDAMDRNLDRGIIAGRAQHHGFGRKARTRTHQPLQLAARLQLLKTPKRGDHLGRRRGGSQRSADRRGRPKSCGGST
jgi:hypothetical protein